MTGSGCTDHFKVEVSNIFRAFKSVLTNHFSAVLLTA